MYKTNVTVSYGNVANDLTILPWKAFNQVWKTRVNNHHAMEYSLFVKFKGGITLKSNDEG